MRQSIQEWTEYILWKTPFKKLQGIWSAEADHILSSFLKAVFHKIYLVHSSILCPIEYCKLHVIQLIITYFEAIED